MNWWFMDENNIVVMKFGGTSVSTIEKINNLADRAIQAGREAVSYTHLDVYKRQWLFCARNHFAMGKRTTGRR